MTPATAPPAARTLRNYAGGRWLEADAPGGALEDHDPASGELAAMIPLSGPVDVDAAVRAAREAQPEWRAVPPQRRARAVMALREALWEHHRAREQREQLRRLESGVDSEVVTLPFLFEPELDLEAFEQLADELGSKL